METIWFLIGLILLALAILLSLYTKSAVKKGKILSYWWPFSPWKVKESENPNFYGYSLGIFWVRIIVLLIGGIFFVIWSFLD